MGFPNDRFKYLCLGKEQLEARSGLEMIIYIIIRHYNCLMVLVFV